MQRLKDSEIKKRLKSAEAQRKILSILGEVDQISFAFPCYLEDIDYNVMYLEEFGHDVLVDDFLENIIIVMTTASIDCLNFITDDDVSLMLSKMRSASKNVLVYNKGKKQTEVSV